jgi:hypothetical protein
MIKQPSTSRDFFQRRNDTEKIKDYAFSVTRFREPLINLIVIASEAWQSMSRLDCHGASTLALTVNPDPDK